MRRFLIFLVGGIVVLGGLAALAGVGGYYVHKLRVEPVYSLAERVEAKARRVIGAPSKTAGLVDTVDTLFLRFEGDVYEMPDNDFKNGGALSLWGSDPLVMHNSGRVFYLDEAAGRLVQADIRVPDNGRAGYAELAADKYPGRRTRIDVLRYNDIEFIDSGALRGFLLSYTFVDVENECYRSRVNWAPVPEAASIREVSLAVEDWELVFQSSPCLAFNETAELMLAYMAGGRMAFKAPNLVYLGMGEYHLDGHHRPDPGIQSWDSDYGKTIEIDLVARTSRVFSKGHRNLQGVTLDTEGRLWVTEHGMRGGDELNLVLDGEDYGWPSETLGTLYTGAPMPSASGPGRHVEFKTPAFSWLPSAAVSSLATVDGFHETWDGDLLIGSLAGRTLFRARTFEDRLVFLEEIPIGQRIRDVMQIAPDRLALWLDTNELVILTQIERRDPLEGLVAGLTPTLGAELAERADAQLRACGECHSYEKNAQQAGPSLFRVHGSDIASTGFSSYTEALKAVPGTWTSERLSAYLADPASVAEGTAMTGLGIADPVMNDALVKAFEWLAANQTVGNEEGMAR